MTFAATCFVGHVKNGQMCETQTGWKNAPLDRNLVAGKQLAAEQAAKLLAKLKLMPDDPAIMKLISAEEAAQINLILTKRVAEVKLTLAENAKKELISVERKKCCVQLRALKESDPAGHQRLRESPLMQKEHPLFLELEKSIQRIIAS